METYQHLIGELDAGGQHLSDQLSEIDLSDPEDARVLMPEQGTDILAHFGSDHFMERYQRYKAHISEWRQQYPKLAEVDLRYEQQVVLQMTGGANASPAKLNPSEPPDSTLVSPKPEPGKPEAKADAAKPAEPKHVETAKPTKAHVQTKPPAKTKATKKKHPDSKHPVKKTTSKPTPKPHTATTTGQ
jgi:cell division protein FtsQ